MCDPMDTTKVGKYHAIQSALSELVSAQSSLNMPPEPLVMVDPSLADVRRPLFLSETDGMVQHSIEHMHAAFRLLNMAHHDQESLKTQVYRLVTQLRELGVPPCIKTWLDLCSRCNLVELADPSSEVFCAACMASLPPSVEGDDE